MTRLCMKCGEVPVKRYGSGYCPACFNRVRRCSDEGCERWLNAVNRSGWCSEHAQYGAKLLRIAKAEAKEKKGW